MVAARSRHRWVAAAAVAAAILAGAAAAGVWWLTRWVAADGRARLETQLTQRLGVDVSIERAQLTLWQGLLLSEVSARRPNDPLPLAHATILRVRVAILPLLRRVVAFRIGGSLTVPCETDVAIVGEYGFSDRALRAELRSSDITLEQVAAPLRQRLPPELRSAGAQLTLRVVRDAAGLPAMTGHVKVSALAWERAPLRITARADVDVAALPPAAGETAWRLRITAQVRDGVIDGLPVLTRAERVGGTILLEEGRMSVESLQGTSLGSTWRLQADSAVEPNAPIEAKFEMPVDLEQLARQVPAAKPWQPSGVADVVAVWRGPVSQWPNVEVLAKAVLRDGGVTWRGVRLTGIAGPVAYDHLPRLVTIASLRGRLEESALAAAGSVRLTDPPSVALTLDADTDLRAIRRLAPPLAAVADASGPVRVRAAVRGPVTQLEWDGEATLRGVRVALTQPPVAVEDLAGAVAFSPDQWATRQLGFTVDRRPIVLSGAITGLRSTPRAALSAQLPGASAAVNAVLGDQSVQVERADLAVGRSRITARGRVARSADQASDLTVQGAIDLDDLDRLPWGRIDLARRWRVAGDALVQLRVQDELRRWPRVRLFGTVSAEQLTIRELTCRALRAEVEQSADALAVRVLNAMVADGRLTGEYRLVWSRQPATMRAEADLVRADLAQIARAVPAWREAGISGVVSGRARLEGPPGAVDQLAGDGWLHAEGEHLGEIPLLDRLFSGALGGVADRLGLSIMRRAQLREVSGQWRLAAARVSTDDLRLLGDLSATEPVTLHVKGSVGLDKTLDFMIEPEFSEQLALQSPLLGGLTRMSRLVSRHHLGGTIDKPQYKFELTIQELLNQAIPFGLNQLLRQPDAP